MYLIFGVGTTAVDYVCSYLCHYRAGLPEITSNTIAWVMAVIFAYVTNKLWVFESKNHNLTTLIREMASFAASRVITLLLSDVFLIFTGYLGIDFMISKIIISVVVVILNYILSKLLVFKKNEEIK